MFHGVVVRGRFSLPAPSVPHNRQWAPCHTIVATPLLIAFELLLCIYLESVYVMDVIFFLRMCRALMPGDDESISDEAIWETLPHFWVAISMVFFVAATIFTLLKLCGDVGALGWWDLFINFGYSFTAFNFIDLFFEYYLPVVPGNSTVIVCLNLGDIEKVTPEEDQQQDTICGVQDIGGHIMKIPIIGFQVLLCMRLEGTPAGARHIPLPILFSPLFLLHGAAVLFSASRLIEKIVLLLQSGAGTGLYFRFSSRAHDCLGFLHHGSRYNTFSGYPPEIVKKMPKKDLAEEVWRLQAALGEQTEITKFSQQERKSYVGFALREKLVWFCSPVGIVFFAVPAARSVGNAQSVVSASRNVYLYMMFNF
ncbi:Transmembrane Fragile-X-F-associated protein - like 2 [Theobroma cacao]|nr:Transmembrane Fragile-X-F-associated protein - like 2 [Theobroma cacao]